MDDTPLFRTLARIGDLAAGPHADVYTGLAVDEARAVAEVWRIPSAAFEEAVCAAAEKRVTVRFHDTDVSRTELEALAQRIGEDVNRWDGAFQLREVGIVERGVVSVGVDDPGTARPLIEGASVPSTSRSCVCTRRPSTDRGRSPSSAPGGRQ